MKKYKEFLITAEPFNSDLLSGVLWESNISGINEEVNCIKVFTDDLSLSLNELKDRLQSLKNEKLLYSFTIEENIFENKNWNEEWEQSINVIHVSDKIVIKPTFRNYNPKSGQIVLTIDPKMSFGTGEHQTTKLVLMLLEIYTKMGARILDVGSGSGILAIASIKLGARHAVAIDIDEWCLDNAIENSKLNNVNDSMEVLQGEITDIKESDFDMILANIQKNILLEIAPEIYNRLKPGGIVILSGLLDYDEADIKTEFTSLGLNFLEIKSLDSWIALVFQK
ncbi:MAG: 50S ribosomal protein L11 methyltransferase [Ignavibacteriaceae bacterium]|nr:50S ribosomal protein L11 methyltransferase [Ignavibacteriaceae bacterium]